MIQLRRLFVDLGLQSVALFGQTVSLHAKSSIKRYLMVLKSDDPIDTLDFNCVDYINQLFPNEQSLVTIDETTQRIQCEGTNKYWPRWPSSPMCTLYEHIIDVKARAEHTEEMVNEIIRDIKQLDCANRNVTSSITTLNHFHMLVGGIESFEILIEKRSYGEILNSLQAIAEVNQHFQQYLYIEEIKNLSQSVDKMQISLAHQITEDFKEAFSVKRAAIIHVCVLISCFSGDLNNSNNNNNLNNINLPSPYPVTPVSSASSAMVFTHQIINNQHHLRQAFYSNTNLSDRRHSSAFYQQQIPTYLGNKITTIISALKGKMPDDA
ncbi:hypothetical protein GQX74_004909 [Glossina fuscipes]|nr:hypothetical protein GQX74_004909 [Glossina fuscipes]